MYQFVIANFVAHSIGGLPSVALFQRRAIYQFSVFISLYSIVVIHGLIPFQHAVLTRQLDNAMTCLLFSIVGSFLVARPAADILLPLLTLSFYVAIVLTGLNQDLSAFLVETAIISSIGLYKIYVKKSVPRPHNWHLPAAFFVWSISNLFYLALSYDVYVELVHRCVTSIVFSYAIHESE